MINKESLEKLLEINGISPTAPDEVFKELLLEAKWSGDDIETALTVLRENKQGSESRVSTIHQTFTSGDRLTPQAISNMLGVDVAVPLNNPETRHYNSWHFKEMLIILVIAVLLAVAFFVVFTWYFSDTLSFLEF